LSIDRQKSQKSKGIRFSQVAVAAISLIVAAGAWYGVENSIFDGAGAERASQAATADVQANPDADPSVSPDGYLIKPVPGTIKHAGGKGRSRAAEFAWHVTSSSNSRGKGTFQVSAGERAAEQKREEEEDLAMPEWEKIINPDGTAIDAVNKHGHYAPNGIPDYADLYSAFEAGYVEEVISNGVATDMSALLISRDVSDEVLYNGAVSAAHDLGNFFYLLTASPMGNLRFYFGVERLRTSLPTFIEFELNQKEVRVGSGMPWWDIQGSRRDGDLLVRFNLISGSLTSVELAIWYEGLFHVFDTDTQGLGSGCREHFSYIYCIGMPPIDRSNQFIEVWDEDFVPVEPTLADSFVELGIDMSRLMGSGSEFSSVYVRTPEDVLFTRFSRIGSAADYAIDTLSRTERTFDSQGRASCGFQGRVGCAKQG